MNSQNIRATINYSYIFFIYYKDEEINYIFSPIYYDDEEPNYHCIYLFYLYIYIY